MYDKKVLIKAIGDSIAHWKDIRARLEYDKIRNRLEYDKIYKGMLLYWEDDNTSVECYTDDCPLCQLYRIGQLHKCNECPILIVNENDCDHFDSEWSKFSRNPNKNTCDNMIENLETILEYYKEK